MNQNKPSRPIEPNYGWRGIRVPLVIAVALVLLVYLLGVVCFEVIDDIGAIMILSGADGFHASAEVPFISTTLNHLIFRLYQWYPDIAWYGWLLTATTTTAATVLICLVIQLPMTKPTKGAILLFTLVVLTQCLLSPTYTKSALLCLFSSFVVLIQSQSIQKSKVGGKSLIAILYWLSYFWRWKVTLIFTVFAFPVLLIANNRQLQRLSILLAVIAGPIILDQLWYSSLETDSSREFLEFYELRSRFFDRPEGATAESPSIVASRIGWHPDDYQVIRNTFLLHDEQRVSTQSLRQFLDENAKANTGSFSASIQRAISALGENKAILLLAIAIGILIATERLPDFVKASSIEKTKLACVLLALAGIIGFLLYFRMVPRIAIPIAIYTVLIVTVFPLGQRQNTSGSALQQLFAAGACLLVLFVGVPWITEINGANSTRRAHSEIIYDEINFATAASVLIRLTPQSTTGFNGASPLITLPQPKARFIPAGWQIRSPRYQEILSQLGFHSGRDMLSKWNGKSQLFFITGSEDHRMTVAKSWLAYLIRNKLVASDVIINTLAESETGGGWALFRFCTRLAAFDQP